MLGYYFELAIRSPERNVVLTLVPLLVLCQLAVLWPALRAASIPPASATRGL
jgi:hypothetical protein